MKIIDLGPKDGMCIKCHGELGKDREKSGIPICAKCMEEFMDIVRNGIAKDTIEEFSDDVRNLTDFIYSSSRLMGLDDIVVIQVCFNIYMSMVRKMGRDKPSAAKKIFKDAKRFVEIELERLEDSDGNNDNNDSGNSCDNPFRGTSMGDIFEKMMDSLNSKEKDNIIGGVTRNHENSGDHDECSGCDSCNGCDGESVNDTKKRGGLDGLDGLDGIKNDGNDEDNENEKGGKTENGDCNKKDGKDIGKRIKID